MPKLSIQVFDSGATDLKWELKDGEKGQILGKSGSVKYICAVGFSVRYGATAPHIYSRRGCVKVHWCQHSASSRYPGSHPSSQYPGLTFERKLSPGLVRSR